MTSTRPPKNWIAVACAAHARRGRDSLRPGFMQVCHGKAAPLSRIAPGDRVCYYAPTEQMGGGAKCQKFISWGVVQAGAPYAFDMGGGFVPYRRDVAYVPAQEVSILPLLDAFAWVADRQRWGAQLRFGLLRIDDADMRLIAQAMGVDPAHSAGLWSAPADTARLAVQESLLF